MKVILLSGGSGKRLWPLSNDVRSKQFLRVLPTNGGSLESMMQRMVRMIEGIVGRDSIVVATGKAQQDIITNQVGNDIHVVTEPERRDTFPAIALATAYVEKRLGCGRDETVVVVPCDPYTDEDYFETILKMGSAVANNAAELVLMGIRPTCPSTKFGYVVPQSETEGNDILKVKRFTEKPDETTAEKLIKENAFWNGGVFAFRLGYMTDITARYVEADSFDELRSRYAELPRISFDYEVAEKAQSVAIIPFGGKWKDLGTWNALSEELPTKTMGYAVIGDDTENTNIINELDIPVVCAGVSNVIAAATADGILIADKNVSEQIKELVGKVATRPMCEERRWGTYKVLSHTTFTDGFKILTKELRIKAGCNISYQRHSHRDEVWTFVDGCGTLVLDGVARQIARGDTVTIRKGMLHAVRAKDDLTFIEVQSGDILEENDIERFDWVW